MYVKKPVKVLVANLIPGMTLAHPVYDFHGQFLLQKGTILTENYIKALQNRCLLTVYAEGVAIPDDFITHQQEAMEETIRANAFASIQNLFEEGDAIAVKAVAASVESIMRELMAGKIAIGALTEISSTDSYAYAHSVDVCILSLEIGIALKYEKSKLLKLGVGCMLHDLGKVKTPIEILNKTGELTYDEYEILKKHPRDGYYFARSLQPDLEDSSALIIYRHHERYDGSGYPLGLMEKDIDEMSSICAIAEVYSSMTVARAYQKATDINEVYEYLMAAGYNIAGQRVLAAFLHCVTPFPEGSMVLLSTGDIGVVTQINHGIPLRPKVYITVRKQMIDLSSELSVTILKMIDAVSEQMMTLWPQTVSDSGA
jgi:HD-GYP domain-containing protein (c-di-GMP phosphodiesterase class II)